MIHLEYYAVSYDVTCSTMISSIVKFLNLEMASNVASIHKFLITLT